MSEKNNRKMNEKGQTLLFVVVAVTIALAVGVSVSTRTLNSLRRVSRTDTSSRIIAVAEGGIENLLNQTYDHLDGAIGPADATTCGEIGADYDSVIGCFYNFPESGSDLIPSRAVVTVEKFEFNGEDNGYSFNLDPDSVKEISLSGYDSNKIKICWENSESAIYYYSYSESGSVKKGGIKSSTFDTEGFMDSDSSGDFGGGCKEVDLVSNNSYGLRIRVLYNPSKVVVFPVGGELPYQGYKLTSRGEITSDTGEMQAATVIVYKSYPYASGIFDYGIYTTQTLQ